MFLTNELRGMDYCGAYLSYRALSAALAVVRINGLLR